ncbi:MAG: hypothetical protein AAFP89_23815, partial [Bacteroidota bacterium]
MKKRTYLYFSLVSFVWCMWGPEIYGQDPAYQEITMIDGLPSRAVHAIAQQEDGALIVGTGRGLFLYDGQKFEKIPFPDSARSEHVFDFRQMKDGSFAFLNAQKHLYKYEKEKIERMYLSKLLGGERIKNVHIHGERLAYILIETNRRLLKLDWEKQEIVYQIHLNKQLYLSALGPEGGLWTLYRDTISVHTLDGRIIHKYVGEYTRHRLNSRFFLKQDGTLLLWVGVKSILVEVEFIEGEINLHELAQFPEKLSTYFISEGGENELLIGTDKGLWIFEEGGEIRHYFKDKTFYAAIRDREANYWLAVYQAKILFVTNMEVVTFNQRSGGLPNDWVKQIEIIDTQTLAVHTKNAFIGLGDKQGLSFLQGESNIFHEEQLMNFQGNMSWFVSQPALPNKTSISIVDPRGEFQLLPYRIPSDIRSLIEHGDEEYLGINEADQLVRLKANGQSIEIKEMLANQMKLAKFYPEYISNHIWIGGYNTLMVCKDDGLYRFTESFPDRYYITAIHEDMDSCIWVLSWHDGLRVWKKQPDNQYVYQGHKLHQREGTALEVVGRDLWIGTSVGLFRYDIPTGNCRKYGFAEGLVSEDVIALKAFRGELWVGTTGGISTIPLKPETEEVAVKPKIKVH